MKRNRIALNLSGLLLIVFSGFSGQVLAQSDAEGSTNLLYTNQYKDGINTNASYDNLDLNFSNFYEYLAPYGQWIEEPKYGYVWSPNVDANFRPYYTNGHWAMTQYGNTWVSEYQWGWVCFHYGRWFFDAYYGWLWIPGQNWGPAWVAWRSGPGYYGWAPLAPGYEYSDEELKQYSCPKDWWIFIPPQYIYSDNYYRYYTGPMGNNNIIKNTKFINNIYTENGVTYAPGPTTAQTTKITEKPVKVYHLGNSGSPKAAFVHNDLIKMYRPPLVKAASSTGEKLVPPDFVTAPRSLALKADAVNTNGGNTAAFRNDLPNMSHTNLHPVAPVNTPTAKGNWYDEHRADKTEYKTDIKTTEPPRRGGPNSITPKPKGALPAQGTQSPEPVEMPKKKEGDERIKVEQHADPVPALPAPNPNTPAPTPKQNPEPLPPSGK